MSIYTEMQQAGIQTDHHESDLYVIDCPESRAILANYGKNIYPGKGFRKVFDTKPFYCEISGDAWLDIPFAYVPFWESKP